MKMFISAALITLAAVSIMYAESENPGPCIGSNCAEKTIDDADICQVICIRDALFTQPLSIYGKHPLLSANDEGSADKDKINPADLKKSDDKKPEEQNKPVSVEKTNPPSPWMSYTKKILGGTGMFFLSGYLIYNYWDVVSSDPGGEGTVYMLMTVPAFTSAGVWFPGEYSGENGKLLHTIAWSYIAVFPTAFIYSLVEIAIGSGGISSYPLFISTLLTATVGGAIFGYHKSKDGKPPLYFGDSLIQIEKDGAVAGIAVPVPSTFMIRTNDERVTYCGLARIVF